MGPTRHRDLVDGGRPRRIVTRLRPPTSDFRGRAGFEAPRLLDLKMPSISKPGSGIDGQTFRGGSLLVRFANFVKLPHTVFALPFALLGVVYASFSTTVAPTQLFLVAVAFTAARFAAMGFNRIVDLRIDALNPRTVNRELVQGKLTLGQAWGAVMVTSLVFLISASLLNTLCMVLAPLALAWILSYSYTKHFTNLSQLWLGVSLAIAPVGGYLAVTGAWSDPAWTLLVLAAAVFTWVAGFDTFYALQDETFDREHGLRSLVVQYGRVTAIRMAKTIHGLTIGCLIIFGLGTNFGGVFLVGIGIAAGILAWEHQLVKPDDLSRVDAAFFMMNGIMSLVVFTAALIDRMI